MTRFTLVHEVSCDAATFWKTFFDRDYNARLYLGELGFPSFTVVEQREDEKGVLRRVQATPKTEIPAALAKLIGPNLQYTEEGTYDAAKGTFVWSMRTNALGEKLKNGGTLRVEAAGDGKVRRIVEAHVEASVFGLGGMIESTTEKQVRDGWEKSARFINRWVKGDRPA